jgi:hypothetical protein
MPLDTRLDPYRDRVAALTRESEIVGHVLILTQHYSTPTGGHLWWRRWADREVAVPDVKTLDGSLYDDPVNDSEQETELDRWIRDEFPLLGEILKMRWLSRDEALEVAPELFGVLGCLDNDGAVIWSFPAE